MVAALRPVPAPELDLDGCERLVEAALHLWVADARRWLLDADLLVGETQARCEQAWVLIVRRPDRVPLIDLAASLGGLEPGEVWRLLEDAVLGR